MFSGILYISCKYVYIGSCIIFDIKYNILTLNSNVLNEYENNIILNVRIKIKILSKNMF